MHFFISAKHLLCSGTQTAQYLENRNRAHKAGRGFMSKGEPVPAR
jgi:hypothetical protein